MITIVYTMTKQNIILYEMDQTKDKHNKIIRENVCRKIEEHNKINNREIEQ
jgi:hypothetical protein